MNTIATEVANAIREATAEVGNGTPLAGTIVRPGVPDESTYPVTPGVDQTFNIWCLKSNFEVRDRQGTNIQASDIRLVVTADSQTDPRNGDQIIVSGKTYNVESVQTEDYGGVPIRYIVQARSGG